MANFFTSSIGKKLMMSLAGLFLVVFLLVHLGVNLSLVFSENSDAFNIAANFMGSNIVIKIFEVVLFAGLLLHIIYGLVLSIQNLQARPVGYAKSNNSQTSFFSKYMLHTALIVLAFMVIHMFDFYFKVKIFGDVKEVLIDGVSYHDLGAVVVDKFKLPLFAFGYVLAFIFLGFHLHHAFQSAFQTLGLNHKTYTPCIKTIGVIYSIVVTIGFSIIPLMIYFGDF